MKGLTVRVTGDFALFTDPMTKAGGEKYSYLVPTAEACRGILSSIYWKPSIIWKIKRIRIVNPIQLQTRGMAPSTMNDGERQLAYYTYLKDVEYEIEAEFDFPKNQPHLAIDFNTGKHIAIAKRAATRGGRRDVYLGSRECQAYVELCSFNEKPGYYDHVAQKQIGTMFHSFNYEHPEGIGVAFTDVTLQKGIIDFSQFTPQFNRVIKNTAASPQFVLGTTVNLEDDGL